jgi:hypothetical protein
LAKENRSDTQRFARFFRDDPEHPNPLLSPPALFSFLAVIGSLALVFGVLDISNTLRAPFQRNSAVTINSSGVQELSALKQKDTDGDGLNDYDELYVHNTSPYLKDSDSDGFDDAQELNTGNDPNCPRGQNCTNLGLNTNATPTTNQPTNAGVNGSVGSTLDAATLRETLKNAGAPASVIDSTDDATLLKLYQDVVAESSGTTNVNGDALNTNALSGGAITLDVLNNLSIQEIRDLLISNGVDEQTINSLSDTELRAIFQEAVQQQNDTDSSNTNG